MKLGKRTAKLVREAAVAGFVMGTRWTGYHGDDSSFPDDTDILVRALRCAEKFPDLYPTLSKVESDEVEADRERRAAELGAYFGLESP